MWVPHIMKPNIGHFLPIDETGIVWGRFLEAGMKAWDKVRKADPLTQSFTPLFSSDFKNCETFLMWFFYRFMNLYTFLTKVS